MCLKSLLTKPETEDILKDMPKEGLVVYKVMEKLRDGSFVSVFYSYNFEEGINSTTDSKFADGSAFDSTPAYVAGFHSFTNEEAATIYKRELGFECCLVVVECLVKKDWITSIGQQLLHKYLPGQDICIVSNKIQIDKFPKE